MTFHLDKVEICLAIIGIAIVVCGFSSPWLWAGLLAVGAIYQHRRDEHEVRYGRSYLDDEDLP